MNPLTTTITPADWLILTTGATIDDDGNVLIPSSSLATMCRIVDRHRGISKSSEKARVKKSRTEIDERTKAEMLVILQREPDISERKLSLKLGLGENTINANSELHAIYKRHKQTRIVNPKFDNDPY